MAFDAFLKLGDIKGESTDRDHKDEIVIESFSWALGNTTTPQSAGGGAGAGKVSMQDFHFTMRTSLASPVLMQACASGKHFPDATLTARKAGEKPVEFLIIKMNDVIISSYQLGGEASGEVVPMDQISLNYTKIDFFYTNGPPRPETQDADRPRRWGRGACGRPGPAHPAAALSARHCAGLVVA
jgi:type VI secretion system secreted protein Hcp